jgi:hypothetical protein
MIHDTENELQCIDAATLTPLVRQALGTETVEVGEWRCQRLYGGASLAEGVFRFSGIVHDQGQNMDWALALKVLRPIPPVDDPSHSHYWKREVLAYPFGLLGSLVAPRCFGVMERPDGRCWILDGGSARRRRSRVAARHLGQFNGAYLTGRPIPDREWLSHGLMILLDESRHARNELVIGCTMGGSATCQAACFRFMLALADEARQLKEALRDF